MDVPNFRLDGKVALLTGSGRGIGLGMAQGLAWAGAAVVIQDIDLQAANAAASEINAAGYRAVALGGDITDLSLADRLVDQTLEQLGGLHIIVNNASIQIRQHWSKLDFQTAEKTYHANILTPMRLCQRAVPIFTEQKFGRIINVSSVQQRYGNANMLDYSMSKAALHNMTLGIFSELAPLGITVNTVTPGYFDTIRNQDHLKSPQDVVRAGKHLPLGRLGEPRDCGGLAVLLCSPAGEYITGESYDIDGGQR